MRNHEECSIELLKTKTETVKDLDMKTKLKIEFAYMFDRTCHIVRKLAIKYR